jgi:hypothetical protein
LRQYVDGQRIVDAKTLPGFEIAVSELFDEIREDGPR